MQVTSQTNNYQSLSAQQQPITIQPIQDDGKKPTNIDLSPEKQLEINNTINDKKTEITDKSQEEKDQRRNAMVDLINHQSKKSQVEIYLSVAMDSKVESNDTINSISTLRDVQKQNNAVEAYATYQENQGNIKPTPMEG